MKFGLNALKFITIRADIVTTTGITTETTRIIEVKSLIRMECLPASEKNKTIAMTIEIMTTGIGNTKTGDVVCQSRFWKKLDVGDFKIPICIFLIPSGKCRRVFYSQKIGSIKRTTLCNRTF